MEQGWLQEKTRIKKQTPAHAMPIKKPNEYRPDYRPLLLIRMAQDVMGSLEGEAGATYHRLLEEHHQHVVSLVQARRYP